MKKVILVLLTSLPLSLLAQTQIVNSWKDPAITIQNPGFHKIVVAALINDQVVRHQIEDYMSSLYPGVATQSYEVMGGDSLISNEAAQTVRLKNLGYDGIVIMKQVDENTTQQYVPGRMPTTYNTWGGYWGYWGGPRWVTHYNPGTPGHVQNSWTWYVQVNVFALNSNKLIWAANTVTTNPGGRVPLFEDVCNAVRNQMSADGFLQ